MKLTINCMSKTSITKTVAENFWKFLVTWLASEITSGETLVLKSTSFIDRASEIKVWRLLTKIIPVRGDEN